MSEHISHKYIQSHWLIFAIQGIVALVFGSIALFTGRQDTSSLVAIASASILALGTVEFFNLLHRERKGEKFGFSAILAIAELIIAAVLLLTLNQDANWHIAIIAGYTLARGIFEIINALRPDIEATDRFLWLTCGVCGAIFGFAILNAGQRFFVTYLGVYFLIFGLTNLFYGVHNRNEKLELLAERKLARTQKQKAQPKTVKTPKVSKKTTKKTAAKKTAAKKA